MDTPEPNGFCVNEERKGSCALLTTRRQQKDLFPDKPQAGIDFWALPLSKLPGFALGRSNTKAGVYEESILTRKGQRQGWTVESRFEKA